jgi:hypothetical protein
MDSIPIRRSALSILAPNRDKRVRLPDGRYAIVDFSSAVGTFVPDPSDTMLMLDDRSDTDHLEDASPDCQAYVTQLLTAQRR